MTISVVIPSYGQAQYLEQCIQSVLSQTHPADEVIVVDDGSTDGSLEIARKYEPRVKVVAQVNKGLASARNAGIMNATGDYIFFLDADDLMLPNCLMYVFLLLWQYDEYPDVIAPSIRCFTEDGKTQDTILTPNPTFYDFKEGNRLAYCAAIKRSALLEIGGYSPKMDVLGGYEDLALWLGVLSRGKKIVTIKEPLVMYRVKSNSMYKEASKPEKHARLMEQIIKDYPTLFPTKEEQEAAKVQYPKR